MAKQPYKRGEHVWLEYKNGYAVRFTVESSRRGRVRLVGYPHPVPVERISRTRPSEER